MKCTRSNGCLNRMTTNPFIENYVVNSQYQVLLKRYAHKLMIVGVYHWSKPVREEEFDEARLTVEIIILHSNSKHLIMESKKIEK